MGHPLVNRKVITENGQTGIDIARMYCGCDEAVIDIANMNNWPSYDFIPAPGSPCLIPNPVPAYNSNNLNILAYYQKNNIHIASGCKGIKVLATSDTDQIIETSDTGQMIAPDSE